MPRKDTASEQKLGKCLRRRTMGNFTKWCPLSHHELRLMSVVLKFGRISEKIWGVVEEW